MIYYDRGLRLLYSNIYARIRLTLVARLRVRWGEDVIGNVDRRVLGRLKRRVQEEGQR